MVGKIPLGGTHFPENDKAMKIYCGGEGVADHGGPWRAAVDEPATADGACPRCAAATSPYLFGIRIDDAEHIGMERTDPRTHGINLGLPGRVVTVGYDGNGKRITRYEPVRSAEVSSNYALREHAKAANLTPAESGRYRSR